MEDLTPPGDLRARLEGIAGSRRDLLVVAGVIAVLVLVAGFLWQGRAVVEIAPPAVAAPGADAHDDPGAASPDAGSVLFVHVAGAVVAPGLYELPGGSRIADAIAAAGGSKRRGDLNALNLAQLLTDGMKVEVPAKGAAVAAGAAPAEGEPSGDAPISLNGADQSQLETIPGIGPVTAGAILAHRSEIGGFSALEQLLDVNGIGPAKYEAMLPYISL